MTHRITIEIEVTADGTIPPLDELTELLTQGGIDTRSQYLGSEAYDQTSNWGLEVNTLKITVK